MLPFGYAWPRGLDSNCKVLLTINVNLGYDLSKLNHSQITDYVKKAIAGLEIRSSASSMVFVFIGIR